MRVLVATTAGEGHFGPIVPFATALRDAGHEVRVAAPASFAAAVQRAGLEHAPVADSPAEVLDSIFSRLPALSLEAANEVVFKEVFCGIDARSALPDMQDLADTWPPDIVLREVAEYSSLLVAERFKIPQAQVALSLASMEASILPLVDEPLRALGLDRGAEVLTTVPRVTLVPPSFDDHAGPVIAQPRRFRYPNGNAPGGPPPGDWWPNMDDPLVYATFGSVAATIGFFPGFYRAVLTATADLPVRVLLTLGQAGDPGALEPLPSNAHVERWFPQQRVMPVASAIVGHGGFGTTMLGLIHGIPLVTIPLFTTDQHANAARIQTVGAGITVHQGPDMQAHVREALDQILQHDTQRAVARRVAEDIAALPEPAACVPYLEGIAARQ
jgi:UDP:flavonoid glycosyltransferase YjiC (YdhE family)